MKESEMIAQKVIKNAREQEGSGLLSWQESAGHLIGDYAESKKLDALQRVEKQVQKNIDDYNNSPIDAADQHSLGEFHAYQKVLQVIKDVKGLKNE